MEITFKTDNLEQAKVIIDLLLGAKVETAPLPVCPAPVFNLEAPIPAPPVTTPASDDEPDTEVNTCDGSGLDVDGIPWDKRIHSGAMSKTADGRWKKLRGLTDANYRAVMAELKAAPAQAPADVPTPPAPEPEPIPAPPAAPVQVATEFEQFNADLIKWLSDTSLSLDDRKKRAVEFAETLKANGFKSKQELEGNDDTIILIRSLLGF